MWMLSASDSTQFLTKSKTKKIAIALLNSNCYFLLFFPNLNSLKMFLCSAPTSKEEEVRISASLVGADEVTEPQPSQGTEPQHCQESQISADL